MVHSKIYKSSFECYGYRVRPIARVQLSENVSEVELDGILADAENMGYVPRAFAFFYPTQNFLFPGGKTDLASLLLVVPEKPDERLMKVGRKVG